MKYLLLGMLICLSFNTFALTKYNISKGKLHRGGNIQAEGKIVDDQAKIYIKYEVNPKRFIPSFFKKYLKGTHIETLPKEFLTEQAYLDLEKDKEIEIESAYVYHLGRVDYGRYTDSHKVLIKAKNGKSEITAFYHPMISDAGWAHISLTIKKIPIMKTYQLKANIKK